MTFRGQALFVSTVFFGSIFFGPNLGLAQTKSSENTAKALMGGVPQSPEEVARSKAGRSSKLARMGVARTGAIMRDGGTTNITLIGSAQTASPAESFAINGNLAYVCDDNEISVVDISNPSSLKVLSTAVSGIINNSGAIHCSIQRNTLSVFSDQTGSVIGNSPGYSAFSLANPTQPYLLADVPLNKRFFEEPIYVGNFAFVPTRALGYFGPTWDNQYGDLLAVDLTTFASPILASSLEQQIHSQFGGQHVILGATQADSFLLYAAGSSSVGTTNNGLGFLQLIDVSNPQAMQLIGQLLVPGTVQLNAPLISGNVAVAIGNNGGWGNNGTGVIGNIVLTVFDVTTRREPAILSINTTGFTPNGLAEGATQIGPNLFAFSGAQDASGNSVLLIVDTSNPQSPAISSIPAPLSGKLQVVGNVLYAARGSGGFAAYSIPGGAAPASVCPAYIDAMVVVDDGVSVSAQSFANMKAALDTFVSSLHFPSDHVGVASFTGAASVNQTLTANSPQATGIINGLYSASGASYIGAGIIAAQAELTGPRHNPQATPVMVVISDGADGAAPSSGATLAAAAAAKQAGIRIISIQYGNTGTLMQAIASSAADYHQVGQ